jgi:hypothetical protein
MISLRNLVKAFRHINTTNDSSVRAFGGKTRAFGAPLRGFGS